MRIGSVAEKKLPGKTPGRTRTGDRTTKISLDKKVNPARPGGFPFIQRKNFCPCDGGCPQCMNMNRGTIQPGLTIGQFNDKPGGEADRADHRVMRMSEPFLAVNMPIIQKRGFGKQIIKCTRKLLRKYKCKIFSIKDGPLITRHYNTCHLRLHLWPFGTGAYKRVYFYWNTDVLDKLSSKLRALAYKKNWRQPQYRGRRWTMVPPHKDGSEVHVTYQLYRYISEHKAEEYCVNTKQTRPVSGFFEVTNYAKVLKITKIKDCRYKKKPVPAPKGLRRRAKK